MEEYRIDMSDGRAYPQSGFVQFYGAMWQQRWEAAPVYDASLVAQAFAAQQPPLPQPQPAPAPPPPEPAAARARPPIVKNDPEVNLRSLEESRVAVESLDEAGRRRLVADLLSQLSSVYSPDGEPTNAEAAAWGLAGAVSAMGAAALTKFGLSDTLAALAADLRSPALPHALTVVRVLLERMGSVAVSFSLPILPAVLLASDGNAAVREAVEQLSVAMASAAEPAHVETLVRAVVGGMKTASRKVKIASVELLDALACREPLQAAVMAALPVLAEPLIECTHEADPRLRKGGIKALETVAGTIDHIETVKLRPLLLQALIDVDHTIECLDRLMELTFVNAVAAPSLSLMVPVLVRGLRERASDVVKQSSMTACNIFGLVASPKDMLPFIPVLQPELMKAAEHSNPDVRIKAQEALEILALGEKEAAAITDKDGEEQQEPIEAGTGESGESEDLLLSMDGFILAYPGRVLLKQSALRLVRGRCYGLIGQNGVGKTTLLNRVAAKDIAGFPQALKVYYVQHEILEHGDARVSDFILKQSPPGSEMPTVRKALATVGFVSERQDMAVAELSGGWRMKLAIARSMMWTPELLLLDEPTNHLDVGSVHWLQQYVRDLRGQTTVLLVSHDYEFLGNTLTDVVHMVDQQMTYYPMGFREFQGERPEIVEALPSASRSIGLATATSVAPEPTPEEDSIEQEPEPEPELDADMAEKVAARQKKEDVKAQCEKNLQIAKAELAEAKRKLALVNGRHREAEAKLKKWIGPKRGKPYREIEQKEKKTRENKGIRQAALEAAQADLQTAENLLAEATRDLAGDRTFIGQDQLILAQAEAAAIAEAAGAEIVAGSKLADSMIPASAVDQGSSPITFPDPGKLAGIKSRVAPVVKMSGIRFSYAGADDENPLIDGADFQLTMGSRCALLGKNGAGKTTLMKLVVGELEPVEGIGEIWKHRNLRLSYVAQHSMYHLEKSLDQTPAAYIQNRFRFGMDRELEKLAVMQLTDEDKADMEKRGAIKAILERKMVGKQIWYLCQELGKQPEDAKWVSLESLQLREPYLMKLARHLDEQLKAMRASRLRIDNADGALILSLIDTPLAESGMSIRPTTREEVRAHLKDFGIDGDLVESKIKRFSGGQRCRLLLAAAMWSRPHFLALDEPTNYLDNDTLAVCHPNYHALTLSLKNYRHGGVMVISHNTAFVDAIANEWWTVENGKVTMSREKPSAAQIESSIE